MAKILKVVEGAVVVGTRRTPRAYTHAVVATHAKGPRAGQRTVVSWHTRADLAVRAMRDLSADWYRACSGAIVDVQEGTNVDARTAKPRTRQVAEFAPGHRMQRTSVVPCAEVDVLDLVDMGQVDATCAPRPDYMTTPGKFLYMPEDAYQARELEARQARRANTLERAVRNADGSLTLWQGWYTYSSSADQVAADWAPIGFKATRRRVPVTSTVVG